MRDEEQTQLDAEDEALIARVRALPPEGTEPDWAQMARSISAAVGPGVPRPWWQRWLVPAAALATTAAVVVLWLRHPDRIATTTSYPDAAVPTAESHAPSRAAPLWLDGHLVEMNELAPEAVDEFIDDGDDPVSDDLAPVSDLHWIDHLDDQALQRAEAWLDHEKT